MARISASLPMALLELRLGYFWSSYATDLKAAEIINQLVIFLANSYS